MNLELDEQYGICYDCTKQDNCPNRPKYEHEEECPDFEEARYCLTPKGIFCTVTHDMCWDELLGKQSALAWEVYEHRAQENVLDKKAFTSVVTDFGWENADSNMIDIAFDMFVTRLKKLGYLSDGKEKENADTKD